MQFGCLFHLGIEKSAKICLVIRDPIAPQQGNPAVNIPCGNKNGFLCLIHGICHC